MTEGFNLLGCQGTPQDDERSHRGCPKGHKGTTGVRGVPHKGDDEPPRKIGFCRDEKSLGSNEAVARVVRAANLEKNWVDLAPDICRQRAIVEGTTHNPFNPVDMVRYCKEVSVVLDMTPVSSPKTDFAEGYGWCCFMHWKESGMHIYSWDDRKPSFFSIDIYTCKTFNPMHVIRYTEEFFGDSLIKLVWKE